MSFIYFNIWQIKQARQTILRRASSAFERREHLLAATSPLCSAASTNEPSCAFSSSSPAITVRSAPTPTVDDRNESAHPNGNIFFSTQAALDAKITEILRVVNEIQTHSSASSNTATEFLLENHDPEDANTRRCRPDPASVDHENYLSQKDIEICLGFDLASLAAQPQYDKMRECTMP